MRKIVAPLLTLLLCAALALPAYADVWIPAYERGNFRWMFWGGVLLLLLIIVVLLVIKYKRGK